MSNYSEEEYKIFSRLFILNEFSEENLKKLSDIKIGIVGMGGIGCPLSQYLVNSGIKELLMETLLKKVILIDKFCLI
jgi:adenylyltransferase/sulfurtransferase